ncbi:MAG: 50S ribosomal protein L18, partial [Draconibacterium sp.]|nr:50S ribosomal protein L18 [Draconibacterium sp.]
MDKAKRKLQRRTRARLRGRGTIQGSSERPRLAVFKSSRYIYAQVIDDQKGETLAQANSRESEAQGRF